MQERIFFVTCRNLVSEAPGASDFGNGSPTHPEQLRVGEATVEFPDDNYFSDEPAPPSSVTAYPENLTANPPVYGSDKLFAEILSILKTNAPTDVVLYIHGYDTGFREGLGYAAQLQHNINAERAKAALAQAPAASTFTRVQFVIFSWPSEGRMIPFVSYFDDRSEAELAQQPLARALGKLKSKLDELHADRVSALPAIAPGAGLADRRIAFQTDLRCPFKVHLMAQSMGNYVLRCALQVLLKKPDFNPRPAPIFDQIFLCSADEDTDALERQDKLEPLPDIARRVTVYTNKYDRALLVSASTKHLSGRLGREGPDHDPNLIKLSLVSVASVLDQEKNDFPHHYYNRLNPVVQRDILYSMAGVDLDENPVRKIVTQPRQFKLIPPLA